MFRFLSFCCFFLFYHFIFSQPINSRYTKTLNDSVFVLGDVILAPSIEFDFDKTSVRLNSKDSVQRLVDFLIQNPFLIVEISVHTDCRGDVNFNKSLTLRRANSIVDLMLNEKNDSVFLERIIPVGKGEYEPIYTEKFITGSTDSLILIEKYHQTNRRTEIKIIGFINKDFYTYKWVATGTEEKIYIGSNYEDLLFIADKALLEGNYEKAKEFYLRATALAPVNDNYALEQYKKLVMLKE